MKTSAIPIVLLILVLWSSCRSDFESRETTGQLEFSLDTVFLDTVFTNLSTTTASLKVFNRTGEDIFIPKITLKSGENSLYRLNVDGISGNVFENIEILAKDSIYIFIEATVPQENTKENEFLYVDQLQFISRAHLQEIPLITLVKDAVFLFPKKDAEGIPEEIPLGSSETGELQTISGFFLDDEHLKFTAEKPYVIYGYATVPPHKTLSIEAGARLHFHANSGILVPSSSGLIIKGQASKDTILLENEVIFQSDRLGKIYENIPGQWGSIWLQKGSKNHIFEYLTIKNSAIGILLEGDQLEPTSLQLSEVQIYNSAISGIRSKNSIIEAKNLVINNSGQSSLYLSGGTYQFLHSTIANYASQNFREFPSVYLENSEASQPAPLKVTFLNSIIYGDLSRELEYNRDASASFKIYFSHSLLKFKLSGEIDEEYDFSNYEMYNNIFLNENPGFINPKRNNFRLKEHSAAINRGDPEISLLAPLDLLNNDRTLSPDLGAYEFIEPQQ